MVGFGVLSFEGWQKGSAEGQVVGILTTPLEPLASLLAS